jgi:DNA polymerase III delta prime subunit
MHYNSWLVMHAYLLVGKEKDKIDTKVAEIVEELKAIRYDNELAHIAQVRELKSFTQLKVDGPIAIVVQNIEVASTAALNAFLKMLEEPQESIYFILTTNNIHRVIPTVQSRCQVIRLINDYCYDETLIPQYKVLIGESISDKFMLINEYKDRQDALGFINNFIFYLYEMHKKGIINIKTLDAIKAAEETLLRLRQNGNVKLQLANMVTHI